ncbi:NB-ARC domains-containing protein, partial [Tanacetum coccineum]
CASIEVLFDIDMRCVGETDKVSSSSSSRCGGESERKKEMVESSKQDQEIDVVSKVAFPSYLLHTFHHLHYLSLGYNKTVEVAFEIMSPSSRDLAHDTQQPLILPYLEELALYRLEKICHVWKCNWNEILILQNPESQSSFHNLTTIRMRYCHSIKYLFSPLMAKLLSNLKKIHISSCHGIEEVVSNRDDEDASIHFPTNTINFFPHLDILKFDGLRNFRRIGGGADCISADIHDQLKLSQASWSLCQYAREISIEDCGALSSVIPWYAVGQMQKLQVLEISDCKSMTEVFETQEINNKSGTDTGKSLPRLEYITMLKLPKLKILKIQGCHLLKHIFTFSTLESLAELEELEIKDCEAMEVIVNKETGDQKVVFPRLKSLALVNLPTVVGFFLGKNEFSWTTLEKVVISECPQITVFTYGQSTAPKLKFISTSLGKHRVECGLNFHVTTTSHQARLLSYESTSSYRPTTMERLPWSHHNLIEVDMNNNPNGAQSLFSSDKVSQLQKLETVNICVRDNEIEEIFDSQTVAEIPNLRQVDLRWLYSLKYIWKSKQGTALKFPNLTRLSIDGCDSLEYVFTSPMVGSLSQLQELHIEKCKSMKVIVKGEVEECDAIVNATVVFPCLKFLHFKFVDLEGFCLGKEAFEFPSLDTLQIRRCPKMTVFTKGDLSAPKLYAISIWDSKWKYRTLQRFNSCVLHNAMPKFVGSLGMKFVFRQFYTIPWSRGVCRGVTQANEVTQQLAHGGAGFLDIGLAAPNGSTRWTGASKMEVTSAIVGPVVNALTAHITQKLRNITSSAERVEHMKSRMQVLEGQRVEMEVHVGDNKVNNRRIPPQVSPWLTKVEDIKKHVDIISSNNVGCFNVIKKYKAGKGALKLTKDIEGGNTQIWFESRDKIFNDALKFLQDDDKARVIALCGMGGVGKTTLMKQLKVAAKDNKMFSWIVDVGIGKSPNLLTIQQAISAHTGEQLTETNERLMANYLSKRFEAFSEDNKKCLVILDDVWKESKIKLEDIGVASPLPKGVKLLLTSRDESICRQIAVDASSVLEVVRVDVLKEGEARDLFCRIAEISEERDHDLYQIGCDIVKKCGRLPLAIKLIAATLKCQKKFVWRRTLKHLKKNDLDKNVQNIIKISYESLVHDDKVIFLLCGMFPEDYNIPIEDLTRYAWGLKLLKQVFTMGNARDSTQTSVSNLKKAYLLMDGDISHTECVKMHDLVLSFVVATVSKGGEEGFWMIHHDDFSKSSEDVNMSQSCKRISLACKGMSEFPSEFKFPNLSLLKLMQGDESLKFPQDFYVGMDKLQVIAIEELEYPLVPTSFQFSANLRTLCLQECSLIFDLTCIGNLSNLEVLSFANSGITTIPSTFGNLKKLRLLDATGCYNLIIDDGVLKNMVKLEELYMIALYEKACCFTDNNCNELAERSEHLSALEFEFIGNNAHLKKMSFEKLNRFKLSLEADHEQRRTTDI